MGRPDTEMVWLRHCRTDQLVRVPLARYRTQSGRRYRNWRLARHNQMLRPPVTISQLVFARDDDDKTGAAPLSTAPVPLANSMLVPS